MVVGLVFTPYRRVVPDAVAVQFIEENAIELVKWCHGWLCGTDTQLELRVPDTIHSPDPHSGYRPPPNWGTAHIGDWVFFDGDKFTVVSGDTLEIEWSKFDAKESDANKQLGDSDVQAVQAEVVHDVLPKAPVQAPANRWTS
jgi:hypothetical protein